MNQNTIATADVTSPTAVTAIDSDLAAMREQMKELNERRKALMPRLSADEREFLIAQEMEVETREAHNKKAAKLRRDRQFTVEDKDQIAAARLDHRKEINTERVKNEIRDRIVTAYLHSYKLTHKKDGKIGIRVTGEI